MSETLRVEYDADNPYACINKAFLSRPDISMKAKCLLALLLSKHNGWTATIGGLLPELKEGRSAVAGAMRELVAAGYMTRTSKKKPDGTFAYETVTRETPGAIKVAILANPSMRDFPRADNPSAENRTVISNELVNNTYPSAARKTPTASKTTVKSAGNPNHAAIISHYVAGWQKRYGVKAPFSGRDAAGAKALLAYCSDDLGAAQKVVTRYLADDDTFVADKLRHPLWFLGNNLARWVTDSSQGPGSADDDLYAAYKRSRGEK